jgi:anti-repressor protein
MAGRLPPRPSILKEEKLATDIQIFKNEQFGQIRVVERDGEPWFVAVDICGALDIANSRDALTRIDEDEKGVALTDTLGGAQEVAVVNEPGLYSLVLGSRKSEARAFKRWITHDVIPAIRKTGMYATPATVEAMLANPDTMIQVLQAFKDEREQRLALETRVVADAPKVAFADAVETSTDSCLVGQLAKIIRQNGYEIGANRLFEYLRKEGYLCRAGSNRNMPTQRSMEAGWFEVKESVLENPDGSIRVVRTPKVTGKGQIYFVNKFLRPEAVRSESTSGTREGTI